MGMEMDPIPMGSNMDMDLSILSAEEHGDLRVLHERGRARDRLHAQRLHSMSHPDGPDGTGRGRGAGGGRRKRSGSDGSVHEPVGAVRGTNTGNRKQRGRPRLDTKDENAADVGILTGYYCLPDLRANGLNSADEPKSDLRREPTGYGRRLQFPL